ncbi:fibronectin type III domain-containing protein [Nocardioides aquiterrae]|uniref:Fibronectin type-III domain-containing protein n=1 Tax=Nocardioides aquiterrae TaxID=203799 RepID=A0ABN1UPF2_9ACTN
MNGSKRLRGLFTRSRSSRGAAELSVVVVAGSLVAGVLFGSGATRTAVDIADGLTWFTDGPTGEVIEVNPATGHPEARIPVGAEGDTLDIAQYAGRLIVTNRTTGQLTSFDLSSLLASGQQRISPGGATDVLHHDGVVFLLDRDRGTIANVDPVTADAIGEMWSSPTGIADAAIDGAGRIWTIDPKGLLTELRWSQGSQRFVEQDARRIDHSGARSVLVGHEHGVTVFGPEEGIVVQVGTGHELVADAIRLAGELAVPASAPADLVPVSSPGTGTVAIVGDGMVREVEVGAIGCAEPGRPEVFEGLVYVPCDGAGRVIRLTADGHRAGADIEVSDAHGDPDLVLDDGNLLINVPGAVHGAVVHADGTVSSIVRYDDSLPPAGGAAHALAPPSAPAQPLVPVGDHAPAAPAAHPAPAAPAAPQAADQPAAGGPADGAVGSGPRGGVAPSEGPGAGDHGPSGSPPPSVNPNVPQPLQAPHGVTAAELQSGSVQVTWQHAGDPAKTFTVQEEGGQTLVEVDGRERQTTVTVAPGTHRFTVTAIRPGEPYETSEPSNPVTTSGRPGPVTDIVGHVSGNPNDTTAAVTVSWRPPADNGSPVVSYTVVMTDAYGSQTQTVATTTASFTSTCTTTYCNPSPVVVQVTPTNTKGDGPARQAQLSYDGPVPPAPPAAGKQLVTAFTHSWVGRSWWGRGTTRLTLAPPSDWRSFQGTCTWTHTGNRGGEESGEVRCDATSLSVPIDTGVIRGADNGVRQHSIVFTASNGVETVQSQPFQWETRQEALCDRCF